MDLTQRLIECINVVISFPPGFSFLNLNIRTIHTFNSIDLSDLYLNVFKKVIFGLLCVNFVSLYLDLTTHVKQSEHERSIKA